MMDRSEGSKTNLLSVAVDAGLCQLSSGHRDIERSENFKSLLSRIGRASADSAHEERRDGGLST